MTMFRFARFIIPPWRILFSVLLAAFFLTACNPTPPPALRVGSNIWPGYEPLYLARSLGLYDNSPVHLVELPSATAVIHQLRYGNLEAAALTLDETLTLLQFDDDLQIVLVMDYSNGADVILARQPLRSLSELRGTRIGVEKTAVGAIMLQAALQAAGLKPADVQVKYLTIDEQEQAWRSEDIDAVVTFEPVKHRLLKAGATVIFDSSLIPGRIIDVLAVRRDVAAHQPDSVRHLLQGYFEARHYMQLNPADAAQRMAPRLGLPAANINALFSEMILPDLAENHRLLSGEPAPLETAAAGLARLMLKQQLLERPVATDGLARADLLPTVNR